MLKYLNLPLRSGLRKGFLSPFELTIYVGKYYTKNKKKTHMDEKRGNETEIIDIVKEYIKWNEQHCWVHD